MCICLQAALQKSSLPYALSPRPSRDTNLTGISLLDTSMPHWGILFHNDAWLHITGMSRAEVKGNNLWHLFRPADQTQVCSIRLLRALRQHLPEVCSNVVCLLVFARAHA